MEPTRRQPEETHEATRGHETTGSIHGSEDSSLGSPLGQSLPLQGEPGSREYGDNEPKQRTQLLDPTPQQLELAPEACLPGPDQRPG